MALQAISTVEPKRKLTPSLSLSAAAGAGIGAGLRYILPSKNEWNSMDTFVSSAAMNARSANRSILKYSAIGALVASGLALLAKIHTNDNNAKKDTSIDYTKLGALIDAPDYSCEIMWYGE